MNGRDDEPDLVEASLKGDTSAFGTLVRRYQDRLYPTVLRLTGRPEDAQDVIQDAFLRAYQKLGHFHGESSFYTWIYRIAVNLALTELRRRRPVLGSETSVNENHAGATPPSEAVVLEDPSASLQREERDARIQQALNRLAVDYRSVVVLKDLEGFRYEEIAEILRIPIGTVRSRLHRARQELRESLRDLVEEQPIRGQLG